ncbi:MAG: DEAD/DEAH box helicase [Deltaproteobacteria bacterium]|nr:DEAD/DEAH box helicase [Deltaproteobacteria bacterium]
MLFQRSSFDDVLNELCAGKLLPGEITGHHVRPATVARYGELPPDLHPALRDALAERGVARPYTHQAEAIALSLAGRNTVLATPTASGKTLCFNVPVLHSILESPETRALYLFPTKALAQDQYAGVHQLIGALTRRGHPVNAFTFDGDTPEDARRAVREHGHIVITNPDMLHAAVLPQHPKWMKLFENLRWIVIDELHTYRGVFGSHVAHLLRRLLRIARFHGSEPRIIACSATIANPVELATSLTGEAFELVSESGGPTGEHHLVTYNPPVVNAELQIRAGVVRGAVQAASALVRAGVSTIVFAGSRLHVELILKYLREEMARHHLDPELVQGYRGGYLPLLRRKVEAGLRDGRIRCVVATNALEMGIDIGSLDASLIAGYPGSIASFRQQAGRAGRRERRSLTLFVAGSGALDQYLVTHSEHLIAQAAETARINPRNLYVLMDHAKCAAYELPFVDGDAFSVLDGDETGEVLGHLTSHRVLHRAKDRWHWSDRSFPANHVNLRGVPEENFIVIDLARDIVLAEVDFRSTHTTLHEHAIYHVDSKHYQVERLDYDDHKAFVRRVEPDYYTTAMTYTKVAIIQEDLRSQRAEGLTLCSGEVVVTRKFVGFKKVRFHTNEVIGYGEIHLPDLEMHTTSTWFDVPRALLESLPFERDTVIDGLEVVAHALRTVACVRLMCAERDLDRAVGETAGEAAEVTHAAPSIDREPTIFLYDAMPGGVGLAPEIFEAFPALVVAARGLLIGCGCESGCPSCSGPLPRYHGAVRGAALALIAWLERATRSEIGVTSEVDLIGGLGPEVGQREVAHEAR